MLKLRYLFDNRDLAEMLLKNWEHDKDKLSLLDHYRISSNASYLFENKGQLRFLRFSPVEEKMEQEILAEIEFVRFLQSEDYPVAGIVPSKTGRDLERIKTPWGEYFAVAFQKVPGNRLDRLKLSAELITGYGKALGRLHELSRRYVNVRNKRKSWRDQLDWIRQTLIDFPDESLARMEEGIVRSCTENIPVNDDNYGLVHYDFELDNVFYDESTSCFHVIDFDDSLYHWYALDIDQTIDNLVDRKVPDKTGEVKALFIKGYTSVSSIDNLMFSAIPVFRRYVNLYSYTRFLRSTAEQWDNEPEWMIDLRRILDAAKEDRRHYFSTPLTLDDI